MRPWSDAPVLWLLLSVVLAIGVATPWLANEGRSVGVGALTLYLLILARQVFGTVLLSPVQIVCWGLVALSVLGRWLYPGVASASGGASISLNLTTSENARTQFLLLVGAVSIVSGALFMAGITNRYPRTLAPPVKATRISGKRIRFLLWATPVPLIMFLSSYSLPRLLRRSLYIDTGHVGPTSAIAAAGSTLSFAAVALLGYVWATHRFRSWVAIVALAYSVVFFGEGSRLLALVPILFCAGMFAADPSRRNRCWVGVGVALSFYLIGLPLQLRDLNEHGVLPYFAALPGIVSRQHPWAATAQNVLISFPLIGATGFRLHFPLHDLLISLNPLPGQLAGWYDIAEAHRLNAYTPVAGLGEIANAGWVFVIAVCSGIGAVLAWLDLRSKKHMAEGRQIIGLAIVMCSGLFLLFFVQYNLRSAVRVIYYAVALDGLSLIPLFVRGVLQSRSGGGSLSAKPHGDA